MKNPHIFQKTKFITLFRFLIVGVFTVILSSNLVAQITSPNNTNYNAGYHYATTITGHDIGWIYDIKEVGSGDIIHCGYSNNSSSWDQHPSVVKKNGTALKFEISIACISGYATNIFETPNYYVVFGEGDVIGCSVPIPRSVFSVAIDKSTGAFIPSYGLKLYNEQNLPIPHSNPGVMPMTLIGAQSDARTKYCDIRNTANQVTGFMVCSNYSDGSAPASTNAQYSHGSFLLKLDLFGNPDPTFGTNGVQLYNVSAFGGYYNSHFLNVCVNYSGGLPANGILGYAVVGYRNNNSGVVPPDAHFDTDAFLLKVNQVGTIIVEDVFDENQHYKNASPLSYPYFDRPENPMCLTCCSNPLIENNNARAVRVAQDQNGDFLVLAQFDYTQHWYSAACTNAYPQTGFRVLTDPALMRIDNLGVVLWTTNLNESSGADFENDLQLDVPPGQA